MTQIEARLELRDLAKNPLLLNMIVTFHRRFPGAELPKRRVELYREMCLLQLRDRPAARKLETLLTQCEAQTILQILALAMMRNRLERLSRSHLTQWLAKCLQQLGETVDAKDFLEQVVQISELLVEREPDEFEFAHLSFQEYLAASHIAQVKQEHCLYDCFNDDWWKPTVLFYAAQVNPTNLIRKMLQQGAIELAYTCLQETTKRVDSALTEELNALKQTVQISRYTKLEEYLKTGQWRKADSETYRLMIKTTSKEEGQWFESEDFLDFPYDELQKIDSLWVNYSSGRFGFSVQTKIYIECVTKLNGRYSVNGKYSEKELWETFGDRVGWRRAGNWIDYKKLNPSLSSKRGTFPAGLVFWAASAPLGSYGFRGFRFFSSLADRFISCSMNQP